MAYVRRTPVLQRLLTSRPSEGTSRSCQGGFQALNETVRGHLRRWFEGHGAVLSSARVQALRRVSSEAA
jgi:hypothetical protein